MRKLKGMHYQLMLSDRQCGKNLALSTEKVVRYILLVALDVIIVYTECGFVTTNLSALFGKFL